MVETDGPLGAFRAKEWPGVSAPDRLSRRSLTAMATSATGTESGVGPNGRTIENGRFERACTETMAVTFTGPSIAEVEHGGETYEVELGGGVCECADYQFRGETLVCKHVLRACLSTLFDAEQRNTEYVARVAAFARKSGCARAVRGCAGPTVAGPRGLPCQGCIDAVRAPGVDEWTVWSRLVGPRSREAR